MDLIIKSTLCFIVSLIITIIVMPRFIKYLKNKNINQITSEYALEEFKNKDKTPIMGGLLFVIIPVIVYVVLNIKDVLNPKVLFILLSYVLYCSVGFIDDYLVIIKHNNDGLSPITRLLMELGYTVVLFFVFRNEINTCITIPFINVGVNLKWYVYLPFMALLYMAEANAVNFTDGMDGLCAGVSFISLIPFVVLAYIGKDYNLVVLIACVLGGLLGYLKFNYHPAKIFMGDSGSLALGGLFASIAIVLDKTIALFVIGGVFVGEMFCVVVQQLAVRIFHKRVFSYTPIHYSYVIKGYKENNIVNGFYLVTILLSIIGFIIGIN